MICRLSNNETDRCLDVNQDCRRCDHGLDIFLRGLGINLLAPQRELLRKYIENDDKRIYITPARYQGRTYLKTLLAYVDLLLKGE